jgi:hypothetical protein
MLTRTRDHIPTRPSWGCTLVLLYLANVLCTGRHHALRVWVSDGGTRMNISPRVAMRG